MGLVAGWTAMAGLASVTGRSRDGRTENGRRHTVLVRVKGLAKSIVLQRLTHHTSHCLDPALLKPLFSSSIKQDRKHTAGDETLARR
jgi:hypothetical protein